MPDPADEPAGGQAKRREASGYAGQTGVTDMKINDSAVVATRAHITYGWVMHRTADGKIWLDVEPGTDCRCSDLGQDAWNDQAAPEIYRVASVAPDGSWDEFPDEFGSINDADEYIAEKFGSSHDYWILQNGTNVDDLRAPRI